jgi:hypothetical protein
VAACAAEEAQLRRLSMAALTKAAMQSRHPDRHFVLIEDSIDQYGWEFFSGKIHSVFPFSYLKIAGIQSKIFLSWLRQVSLVFVSQIPRSLIITYSE